MMDLLGHLFDIVYEFSAVFDDAKVMKTEWPMWGLLDAQLKRKSRQFRV